jgi:hypothetical protein
MSVLLIVHMKLVGWILLENQSMKISCMSKSESLSMALSVLEKSVVLLCRFLPYRPLTM